MSHKRVNKTKKPYKKKPKAQTMKKGQKSFDKKLFDLEKKYINTHRLFYDKNFFTHTKGLLESMVCGLTLYEHPDGLVAIPTLAQDEYEDYSFDYELHYLLDDKLIKYMKTNSEGNKEYHLTEKGKKLLAYAGITKDQVISDYIELMFDFTDLDKIVKITKKLYKGNPKTCTHTKETHPLSKILVAELTDGVSIIYCTKCGEYIDSFV